MEILKTEFEGRASQRGWNFKQLKRNGNIALYEKTDTESKKVYYETIIIKEQQENISKIGGVEIHFESKEKYPNDEAFGTDGFCFIHLDRAERNYYKLIDEREEKKQKEAQLIENK